MHLVRFDAPRETVYPYLTTAEGVRAWWTPDAQLDDEVDGTGEFRFFEGSKATRIRIDRLDPPKSVVWTVLDSFRPEWIGTVISFELRPSQSGCELLFAQRGYPHADENYAVCNTGWGIYFSRLQERLVAGLADRAVEGSDPSPSRKLSILHRVGVTAEPVRVHEALTTTDGITRWWAKAEGDAAQGGAFDFRGGHLDVVQADERLVRWRYSGPFPDWVGTEIVFRIEPRDDQTVVFFSHQGWREPNEIMGHCSTKWGMYLLSLKDFVEQGDGRLMLKDAKIATDLA
jgi:uncharacterized protein YndB with AHSA1/START domain